MLEFMDKKKVIMLKEQGLSTREVSRQTGHDRKTVSKYWNEYQGQLARLDEPDADVKTIQGSLLAEPKYNGGSRSRRKYTEKLDKRLKEILKEEEYKDRLLGPTHKQSLTNKQIHQKLLDEGFDISGITINTN